MSGTEHFADGHKHKVKGKKKTKKGTERNKVANRSNYHKVTQQLSQDVEAAIQQQPQLQLNLWKMLKALLSTCVLLLVSAFALHLSRDGMLLTDKDHPEGIVAARTQSQLPVNNSFTAPAPRYSRASNHRNPKLAAGAARPVAERTASGAASRRRTSI